MPIYEYACKNCRKIFSFLVRSSSSHRPPACPRCGRKGMKRVLSRFGIGHGEEENLEKLADPSILSSLDERDPKSLARWMRKMGKAVGEEMPEELDELCDRLEAGENPEDIERRMGGGGYSRDDSGTLYDA